MMCFLSCAVKPSAFLTAIFIMLCSPLRSADAIAPLDGSQWDAFPLSWRFHDTGADALDVNAGNAVLRGQRYKHVVIEAEITPRAAATEQWKIAGVGIMHDDDNYWHLALIESPEKENPRHFIELGEMRKGCWLSQTNLKCSLNEDSGSQWSFNQTYRMRLALDGKGIEATVADAQGKTMRRIRYEFTAPAVTAGRPMLRSDRMAADYRKLALKMAEPIADKSAVIPDYDCRSFISGVRGEKTGFFHVEKRGETWWAIDPLGRGFVPLGVDHVKYQGHHCETLGYHPHEKRNDDKYGGHEAWAEETLQRLESWGFNLLAAGSTPELRRRGLAHVVFMACGEMVSHRGQEYYIAKPLGIPGSSMPNVFHPDFESLCRYYAEKQCRASVNDPWLFGYFLDNELAWWGRGDVDGGLFDAVMQMPPAHTAKLALRNFLAARYENDVARLNAAWGCDLKSFDEILTLDALSGSDRGKSTADKSEFAGLVAERYFGAITRAIRAVDANHMILGCRFAGGVAAESVWRAAGRHCDVVTFNYYGNVNLDEGVARDDRDPYVGELMPEVFRRFHEMCGRPMMVTEWSFPALDSGLPCTKGAGQRFKTQAERAKASEIFARTTLQMPFMLGYDYFMWVDEPALGISKVFPENSNYGLINEESQPYELLVSMFGELHRQAGQLHEKGFSADEAKLQVKTRAPLHPDNFLRSFAGEGENGDGPPGGTAARKKIVFQREGDAYTVDAGKFVFKGTLGGRSLVDQVMYDGAVLGSYNAMLQEYYKGNQWRDVNRLTDVRAAETAGGMQLELVGQYVENDRPLCELAHRLTLAPGADCFLVELLWCRNLSQRTIEIPRFYFRLYYPYADGAQIENAAEDAVPNLWGDVAGSAWLNKAKGTIWGMAAPCSDPTYIRFWIDEQGGQHPDAQWNQEIKLAPGETFRPEQPMRLLCIAGRGSYAEWQAKARELMRRISSGD